MKKKKFFVFLDRLFYFDSPLNTDRYVSAATEVDVGIPSRSNASLNSTAPGLRKKKTQKKKRFSAKVS